MKINSTLSGILVSYENYIFTHGKTPSGSGNWAFFLGNDREPRFYEGSFSAAKKAAVRDAKKAGHSRIQVGA